MSSQASGSLAFAEKALSKLVGPPKSESLQRPLPRRAGWLKQFFRIFAVSVLAFECGRTST